MAGAERRGGAHFGATLPAGEDHDQGRIHSLPVPDQIERAAFVPTPPGQDRTPERRWWGGHLRELRWQAELSRLLVDPVYRGVGVPPGDGLPVLLIPGFLAGDDSLRILGG